MHPLKVTEVLYKTAVLALLVLGACLSTARELANLFKPVIVWGFQDEVPLWAWFFVSLLMGALLLGMIFQVSGLVLQPFKSQITEITQAMRHALRLDASDVAGEIPLDYRWR